MSDETVPPLPAEPYTLTLPVSQNVGEVLVFAAFCVGLSLFAYWVIPILQERCQLPRFEAARFIRMLASVLAPIWLLIGCYLLWNMWRLANTSMPETGVEMRWHILALIGLITAFGATVSAPLALIRVIATERQTRTAEQGHMTDRISKAVEQLGTEKTVKVDGSEKTVPNIEVRIGGLLSLERIAQDSTRYDQGRDHVRVMEIICAYVRENAPAREAKESWLRKWERLSKGDNDTPAISRAQFLKHHVGDPAADAEDYLSPVALQIWLEDQPNPREDIQTALNVLKRRSDAQRKIEANWPNIGQPTQAIVFDEVTFSDRPKTIVPAPHFWSEIETSHATLDTMAQKLRSYTGYRLDLRFTNLRNADLFRAEFSGALLAGSILEGANLRESRLEAANLNNTQMGAAHCTDAKIMAADLFEASLVGAFLWRANLSVAKLVQANLTGAYCTQAHLEATSFAYATLNGAALGTAYMFATQFTCSDLSNADFENGYLVHASLISAKMEDTKFYGCWIRNARLDEQTSFDGANMYRARLKEVTFEHDHLSVEQLETCFADATVKLPDGTPRPKHWAKDELNLLAFDDAYQTWTDTQDLEA